MTKFKPILAIVCAAFCCISSTYATSLSDQPVRIVSAGGSVTEIIYALGAQNRLVGVDSSSIFPAQAVNIPNVGYYRQLSTEGLLSVDPTLIIGLETMGPSSVLSQLEEIGIPIKNLPVQRSVNGLITQIEAIGQLVDREANAMQLIDNIKAQLSIVPSLAGTRQKIVFLMSANQRGLMAAGTDTVPDLLFKLTGMSNPFSNIEGFKPISKEVLLQMNPTLILIPNHQRLERSEEQVCDLPSLRLWASSQGCNVQFVDSLSFLGMTPRLPIAAQKLVEMVLALENKGA